MLEATVTWVGAILALSFSVALWVMAWQERKAGR